MYFCTGVLMFIFHFRPLSFIEFSWLYTYVFYYSTVLYFNSTFFYLPVHEAKKIPCNFRQKKANSYFPGRAAAHNLSYNTSNIHYIGTI